MWSGGHAELGSEPARSPRSPRELLRPPAVELLKTSRQMDTNHDLPRRTGLRHGLRIPAPHRWSADTDTGGRLPVTRGERSNESL